MLIDKYKLKVNSFTTELDRELQRDLRCIVTTEVEIYDESTPDNQDGTFNKVWKAKVVGGTDIKQTDKIIKGKNKSSVSQKMRGRAWGYANELGIDEEKHYEEYGNKIIAYWPEVVEFLKSKN